ncbi:MAG: hypothetical protein ACFFD4_31990 [Candidatus Odinarchaeota archaeon]
MSERVLISRIAGEKVPVFLAAMGGITGPSYALKVACTGYTAGVSIGGYDLDTTTHEASLEMSKRRREFTIHPEKLFERIKDELLLILVHNSCFVNVRAVEGDYLPDFCEKIKKISRESRWPSIIELNAHCAQPEMLEIGAGLELARNRTRIAKLIEIIKNNGLLAGLKYKIVHSPENPFNSETFVEFLTFLKSQGLDILHLDSFQKGKTGNYTLPIAIAAGKIQGLMITGNNSILNAVDGQKMLAAGAHAFSIARGYLNDHSIFQRITEDFLQSYQV